jgi:hypothetical protein
MHNSSRYASLLPLVVFLSACAASVIGPVAPSAVMFGEWSYATPRVATEELTLNAGLRVQIDIDSLDGMRFWGHVTLWFAGDVGISPSAFGRIAGRIDEHNGVTLEIPRASPSQLAVMVVGELAGDVLTVHDCYSGADAGPFASGATFERVTTR